MVPEWVSPLLPSVFDGDTVNVFALLRQARAGQGGCWVNGLKDDAPQEIACGAFAGELEAADTLPRMAASVRLSSTNTDATEA